MAPLNVPNRTLYHGDNLAFMRGLNSASVDLIATDPPFNKGRDFHATLESLAAGARITTDWGAQVERGCGVNPRNPQIRDNPRSK